MQVWVLMKMVADVFFSVTVVIGAERKEKKEEDEKKNC